MPKLSEVIDSVPTFEFRREDRYSKSSHNSKSNKKFRPGYGRRSDDDRCSAMNRDISSTQKTYNDDPINSKSEIWEFNSPLGQNNNKLMKRSNSCNRSIDRVHISCVSNALDRRGRQGQRAEQSSNNRKFSEKKSGSQLERPNVNNSSCLDVYMNPPLLRCPPVDINCEEFILTPCQIDVLLSLAVTHASNTAMVDNCKFALLSCDYHTIINNYLIAAKFDLFDVMERLLDQIRANFVCVARTKEFLSLPLDIVMMFLQDNNLNIEDELEVFFAALNWVDFNKMQRLPDAGKVLNCVRYVYINPSDMLQFVEPNLHMFTGPHGTEAMLNMYRYRALILSGTIPAPPNVIPFCQPPATFLQEGDPQASTLVAPIPPPRSLPPDPNLQPPQFAMFPPQGYMSPCEPLPLPPRNWPPSPNFQQVNTVTMYSPQDTPIVRPQSPIGTPDAPSNLPFSCLPVGYIPPSPPGSYPPMPPMFFPGQIPDGMYNSRLTAPGPLTPEPASKSPSAASQAKQSSPEPKGKGVSEKSKSASETRSKDKEASKADESKDDMKAKSDKSKDTKKAKSDTDKKQDSSKSSPEPQTFKEMLTKLKSEKNDKKSKSKEKSKSKSKKKEIDDEDDDSSEDGDEKEDGETPKNLQSKQSPVSKPSSKEKASSNTKGSKKDAKDDSEKGKKSKKKKNDEDNGDDDEDEGKKDNEKDKTSKSSSKPESRSQSKTKTSKSKKDKEKEDNSDDNENDEKKTKTKSQTKSKSQKEDKKAETGGKSATDSPDKKKGSSKSASKEDSERKSKKSGSSPVGEKKSKDKEEGKSKSEKSKKKRQDENKQSEEDKEDRKSKRDQSGDKKSRHKSRSKTKDKNDLSTSPKDGDDQRSSSKRRSKKSKRSKSESSEESPDSSSKKRSKKKSTRSDSRGSRRGTMFLGHTKR